MVDTAGYLWWATALGLLSAVSLPLGSLVGLVTRPGQRTTAVLAAFGAGALIAALSVELVAPTATAVVGRGHAVASEAGHAADLAAHGSVAAFVGMLLGAIVGGVLFVLLDGIVNARGGFLRKTATTISYLRMRKGERTRQMLKDLCRVPLLRMVPPSDVELLVRDVKPQVFSPGEVLMHEGEPGDCLYFVRNGSVHVEREGRLLAELGRGEVLGEISLLTNAPRSATVTAETDVETLVLSTDDFARWRAECPELDEAVRDLAAERVSEMTEHAVRERDAERNWAAKAVAALRQGGEIPTPRELRSARSESHGAGLAIWLGILLDGIPESLVIGAGFLALLSAKIGAGVGADLGFADVIPYTLIAGLFLSNFPEAMSSSVGMRLQGWKPATILAMWASLTVITGVGAGIGYSLGGTFSHAAVVTIEGVAAGAMLTMIASTMIPEAVHLGGGPVAGISTLAGFLAAVAFKLLE